ncbi:F-box protein At4g05010-like [Tasmannia lanceolata]|uniref:F-box protein At4g05010-like n=1 Tax=Tasmannia lanceolata TaxID=3420 RepID=UPI004062BCD8
MTLGKTYCAELGFGNSSAKALGFGNCTRTIGRKRVVISNCLEGLPLGSPLNSPLRKRHVRNCSNSNRLKSKRSYLEALSQDILIRILCGVDHDDLKHLVQVSKTIKEATLTAKQSHFAFNTPSKKIPAVRTFSDSEDSSKFDSREAPNAPRRTRTRVCRKKLVDLAVILFPSPEESLTRKGLFSEMEI